MSTPGSSAASDHAPERRRLLVRGLVQGVGFRPYVYRLAARYGLAGFIGNGPDGVVIEVEGLSLDRFIESLKRELPPLARIDQLIEAPLPTRNEPGFEIRKTAFGSVGAAAIPADSGICEDCLEELFEPANRRFLHPFIACTNCGPRYTMAHRLPYDRDTTSMAHFPLCPDCAAEYGTPDSRRFHAEPICCHRCGPRLSHSVEAITDALANGSIVAIKGVGGFHLACDARNADSVAALRERKRRDGKPFAVMVLNSASARQFATLDDTATALLKSRERPVVVLPSRGKLPDALAPGLKSLGLLLPYTGLHYLLFYQRLGKPAGIDWLEQPHPLALVMTSANLSGDPLVTENTEAQARAYHTGHRTTQHRCIDHARIHPCQWRRAIRPGHAAHHQCGSFQPVPAEDAYPAVRSFQLAGDTGRTALLPVLYRSL